jgi:apolipoprotein N-acyltransferase
LSFFVWFALVPLFLAIIYKSPGYGFFLSITTGIVLFLGMFMWGLEVPEYRFLHHAILALCWAPYFGLFGLLLGLTSRRSGVTLALFAAPFYWVSLEYVRSNVFFLSFPWGLLAHSQYKHPIVIQIASVTGTYGLSFLIAMVNSALTALVYPLLARVRRQDMALYEPPPKQGRIALVVTAALLVSVVLLYGHVVVSRPISGQEFKVAAVQGNIEQSKKWHGKYAKFIMQTYADLTREASEKGPKLIIWPETATPQAINRNPWLHAKVRSIARASGTYLLVGSAQYPKLRQRESDTARDKYFNSAFLIHPESGIDRNQEYHKIHLLPFGEYIPLKGIIPWSRLKIPDADFYRPGKEFTVFQLPEAQFGVTICWENIFPDLVRQFVKRGAQFMVNITNEAWFGKTAAPYQFVSMSVFRAVENKVYVVRAANTGVSCVIDPYGKIADRVKDSSGQDVFVRGVLTRSIIPLESKTVFTRYGDWFALLCFPCSAVFLLFAIFRKK